MTRVFRRLPGFRSVLVAVACVSISAMVDARREVLSAASLPLDVMTFEDSEVVGAVGTGCTWKEGSGRTARLSMADGHAGVRRNGKVVALKPTSDAEPLFLTYDRWTGGTMTIRVRDTGRVVRRGHEFSETAAWLDLVEDGRTRSFAGRLSCGS